MKAFAYDRAHALDAFAIAMRVLPEPELGPKDLLVSVRAFSLNPVDFKIRRSRNGADGAPVVLGWDASGVVEAVGAEVSGFARGDEVYYAGNVMRPGSYAERQAIDHRLVALKPHSLGFADAAALPLTTLTAYESLLERGIDYDASSHVLIIGGAGGVGSIAVQLMKALTPATIIATASRPETAAWATAMGADQVIGRNLAAELARIGAPPLHAILATTHTEDYLPVVPQLLRPFGHLMVIDDFGPMDIQPFKPKAQSAHWESMFAKSVNDWRPESQGAILNHVAELVDAGRVRTTRTRTLPASVEALREGHAALEGGTALGKMVVEW